MSDDQIFCSSKISIQDCIDRSPQNSHIILEPKPYETEMISLRSNMTLTIPFGAIIKLKDNAIINSKAFGGIGQGVLQAKGSEEEPLENIHIILNGEIDGSKDIHKYENGGIEGILFSWVRNSSITGSGLVHSANGDGVDLDAVENINIRDIYVEKNGGSGIHFGSPRPIRSSKNNLVINVTSRNNGFERKRNGFDLSWPNPYGAIYIFCTAENNYRNFEIDATGGIVLASLSIDNGTVIKKDEFGGAEYAYINGKNVTNKSWISKKHKILIKRDIKKFLRKETPIFLDEVRY